MDIKKLEIFIDLMHKRSITTVAKDRDVDSATISRAIKGLEEELNIQLFHRTTRKIEPTEAGIIYCGKIEPLIHEINNAKNMVIDINHQPSGILRISCPVSFAQLNITPLLPDFSKLYPDLQYELILTDSAIDLVEDHIDIAVRVGPLTLHSNKSLVTHKLCDMVSRVCASPEFIRKVGKPNSPEDLGKYNCLLLNMPGFQRNSWLFKDSKGKKTEVNVKEFLRTSNAIALKQCALQGMGITMQALWMIGRELKEGTLVDLFPDYSVVSSIEDAGAWVLYPARNFIPNKVKVFVEYLRENFAMSSPWER